MNHIKALDRSLPQAHFDDLDLSNPADFEVWQARMEQVARVRLELHRAQLISAQIINAQGEACSDVLPPDMRADS